MPMVRTIVRESEASSYRFSSLVTSIVRSTPFQMSMKPATQASAQRAAR
jgi:hypothetical protein